MIRSLALLLAVLLASARVGAADQSAEARQRFRAGEQAFRSGKYLAAARAFEDAYAEQPEPAISFSAAQAYRRQYFVDGDPAWLERSKELYQRYLGEQPTGGRREHAVTHLYAIELLLARRAADEPREPRALPTQVLVSCEAPRARVSLDGGPPRPAPLVAEVTPGEHRIRVTAPGFRPRQARVHAVSSHLAVASVDLVELPGELSVKTATGTEVWIDGARAGVAPLPPIELASGTHGVTLMRAGRRSVSRRVRVERGARTTLDVELELGSQRTAAVWTLGGAGALALGSAVSGGLSLLAERDANRERAGLDSGRTLSPAERDRYNSSLERRNDYRAAAAGLLGAALVSGGAGALLYVFDAPGPPPGSRDVAVRAASARRR